MNIEEKARLQRRLADYETLSFCKAELEESLKAIANEAPVIIGMFNSACLKDKATEDRLRAACKIILEEKLASVCQQMDAL